MDQVGPGSVVGPDGTQAGACVDVLLLGVEPVELEPSFVVRLFTLTVYDWIVRRELYHRVGPGPRTRSRGPDQPGPDQWTGGRTSSVRISISQASFL